MTFLRSLHVKIMMVCIVAFIVAVIGINLFDLYQLGVLGILAIIVFPITMILAGRRYAPAPFNNFTTWIVIIMIGLCILHWIGQDDKELLMSLFTVDFVYMWLLYHDPVRESIWLLMILRSFAISCALGLGYYTVFCWMSSSIS